MCSLSGGKREAPAAVQEAKEKMKKHLGEPADVVRDDEMK
jgi:hypothetical protein